MRTLFPIYFEDLPSLRSRTLAGLKQRQQKRGLRQALAQFGPVQRIDFRLELKRHGRRGLIQLIERPGKISGSI